MQNHESLAFPQEMKRFALFVRRPWSISKAFYFAVAIGALSPVLEMFLFRRVPWNLVPFIFFSLLTIFTGLLYWQVERGQFRRDGRAMLATIAAGLLWVGGVAGSGWCYSAHVCMGGHMEHPPYAVMHYAADIGWGLSVAIAPVCLRLFRTSLCLPFAVLSSFLILYRFLFGSLGGRFEWLPL